MSNQPKLERITLIGFFSDGKHRLITVHEDTDRVIQLLIATMESKITVLETPIENIKLES